MKIAIVIYSNTGKTEAVAKRVQASLSSSHDITIEKIIIKDEKPFETSKISFDYVPDLEKYDALIFGAPVWAFRLTHVMKQFFERNPKLEDKPVAVYAMQGLPWAIFGGNRAIRTFKKYCKNAESCISAGIVSEKGHKKEVKFNRVVSNLIDFVRHVEKSHV